MGSAASRQPIFVTVLIILATLVWLGIVLVALMVTPAGQEMLKDLWGSTKDSGTDSAGEQGEEGVGLSKKRS
ncbi:hypothetical protein AAMO2058_000897500 [Amorphochlora amoebiformis]